MKVRRNLFSFAVAGSFALAGVSTGQITSDWTYNGTTATSLDWENASSWSAGVPGTSAGDTANFNFNITAARTITLNADQTLGTLTIGDPTSAFSGYTLSAATPAARIIFDQTGIANAIMTLPVADSTAANTISAGMLLADNLVIDTQPTSSSVTVLNLSGVIDDAAGSFSITKTGPSLISMSGANSFDGGLTISGGRINLSNASATGTGTVTVDGGAQAYLSASAGNYTNHFAISGTGHTETAGSLGAIRIQGGAIVSGSITLNADARITAHGNTGNLTGNITETTPNTFLELANYSTTANSTITVGGNNVITGGVDIRGAVVIGTSNTAFGSGSIQVISNSTAARVTRLQLGTNVTLDNDVILNSTAQTDTRGAIHSYAGDLLTPSTAVINGDIDVLTTVGNGGHFASEANSASVLRIMGKILVQDGIIPSIQTGTVELGGGGSYSQINALEGTIRLAADQGIHPLATLSLASSGATQFDLNGFDQSLTGLTKGNFTASVRNNGAAPSLLSLDLATDSAFAGTFDSGTAPLSIVKSGAGILTLAGNSGTFDGSFQLNEGGLNLTGTLGGTTSTATFANGTTLRGEGSFGGNLTLAATSMTVDGATPLGAVAAGTLNTNGGVTVNLQSLPATPGPIQIFAFGSHIGASSDFTLAGASNYRSPAFVLAANAVNLTFGPPLDLTWTGTGGSDWVVGSTTNWNDPAMSASPFLYADNVLFGNTGGGAVGVPANVIASNLVINSNDNWLFQGTGTLSAAAVTKDGSGSATFENPVNFYGTVTLTAGTLRFSPPTAVTTTVAGALSGTGTLAKGGDGILSLPSAHSGFTGPVVIAKGELLVGNSSALGTGVLTFGDATTLVTDTQQLTLASGVAITNPVVADTTAVDATVAGVGSISGTATLTKLGTGILKLQNANTHTGATTVVAGKLQLDFATPATPSGGYASAGIVPTALGPSTTLTLGSAATGATEDTTLVIAPASKAKDPGIPGSIIVSADAPAGSKAILDANPLGTFVPTVGGSSDSQTVAGTCNSSITLQSPASGPRRQLWLRNTGQILMQINSKITGTGDLYVDTTTFARRVRLNYNGNDFTGDIYILTGGIQTGNGAIGESHDCFPDSAVIYMSADTRIGLGSRAVSFAGLVGDATATVNHNANGTATSVLTLMGGDSYVYEGTIAQDGGSRFMAVTHSGTGTQTFNGVCSFTGATTISGGKLILNNSYASPVTVFAGGIVGGNMTSTAALTATAAGATVSPGNSTGIMTAASANLSTGGVLEMEINDLSTPANDKLVTTGALNISNSTLNLTVTGTPTAAAYVIASYGTRTGTFLTVNGLPNGYQLVYDFNDGSTSNNIALVSGGADPYLAWFAAYPAITGANRAPDVDFDGDGIANGIEFVIGSDPSTTTSTGLPAGVVSGGNFVFTFKRTDASKAYAVTVEDGTTLASWPGQTLVPTTATAGPPVDVVENGAAADDITVSIPMAGNPRKFARLRANIPFTP